MPDVTIRPLGIDERADWEPLWEGYQKGRDSLGQGQIFFA